MSYPNVISGMCPSIASDFGGARLQFYIASFLASHTCTACSMSSNFAPDENTFNKPIVYFATTIFCFDFFPSLV